MGVFNNQNTFYNSTWHQYGLPVSRQQLQPIKLEVPKIQFPSYTQQWRQFRNNPFGINSTLLPSTDNTYEPFPINPFSYTNYDLYAGQYDNVYSDEDFKKPVSNQTINNVRMGLNGVTQAIDALGQGRTTGAGEKDANYYINAVSKLGSNLPRIAGLVFSGINTASSLLNTLAGSQLNEKNIKAFESAIQNRARWQMGDTSTTDALVSSSANNIDLKVPGVKYFGKDPLLSDIFGSGVGKASGKAWSMKQPTFQANAQAHNTEALGYKDYQNKYIRRGLLAEPYALGGAINRFDNGGDINTPRTHGSLFNTGLTEINAGGRHSENQFGGVQFGVDQYGIPNLVEEGETVFNAQSYGGPQDYAFSDEIEFPIKEYGHLFSLGGMTKRKKGKYKKYTFADVSKYLAEDVKQNPNSDIVKRTFAENAGKLANIQEEVKAKDMINQMNPMDIMMALQQSPMGEQMISDTQGSTDQQAMMGQEPMVAACGGKLRGYGGNLFADGGDINDEINEILGNNLGSFNLRDYMEKLLDPTVYRGKGVGRNKKVKTRQKVTPRKLNHTLSADSGDQVYSPPESLKMHDDLFSEAIEEWIADKKSQYDEFVKQGEYDKALNIQSELVNTSGLIQAAYVNATKNPTTTNVGILQNLFDESGFNKYIDRFLNDKTKGKNGDSYPIYHTITKNGKKVTVPYLKDNYYDTLWGVVTQNRYMSYSNKALKMLKEMGIDTDTYQNNEYIKNLVSRLDKNNWNITLDDNSPEYLRNLQTMILRSPEYYNVVENPKYVQGGTEPRYIYMANALAPEGTEDVEAWWNTLTDEERAKLKSPYENTGELIRTSPYEYMIIHKLVGDAAQTQQKESTDQQIIGKDSNTEEHYIPKPRNDWESKAALLTALRDDIQAQFSNNKDFSPGSDTAYSYLSKVGNIPMVRSVPTGTRMTYRPTDLNFELNNDRNDMFGLLRTTGNLNRGNTIANDIAIMNAGREQMAKTRQQAMEEDIKKLQFVLQNNNQVDQFNAQNSLTAQTTNAQNLAKARETQASIASQLAGTLGQNYKNWIDYRNAQSSGLAQLLHDQGYNKQILNLRDSAFLLNNQQKDALRAAGISYETVQDILNDNYKG